jgi:hypothetical protein
MAYPGSCVQRIFRGSEDNITVILARFSGDELEEPNSDRITIELPPLEEEDKTLDDTYDSDTEPP